MPLLRIADGEGVDVVPETQRLRLMLEPLGPAGPGDAAVGFEPEILMFRPQLAHALAGGVDQARLRLEGGIDLQEPVIDRPLPGVEQHLHDAEAGLD